MTEQDFIEDIRAEPRDWALVLVYADWLEEHGEPGRAEFFRIQQHLDRLNADPGPETAHLRRRLRYRSRQLLVSHWDGLAWYLPTRGRLVEKRWNDRVIELSGQVSAVVEFVNARRDRGIRVDGRDVPVATGGSSGVFSTLVTYQDHRKGVTTTYTVAIWDGIVRHRGLDLLVDGDLAYVEGNFLGPDDPNNLHPW